ncbi:hypothetical protein BCR36DRAFT_414499 [Piromyces finnis]|uniref:Chitin-binding type-1 domain-containing protein n=1 Tax=Piromyces finnis TaxID=1754191 RepID=A0A1Y1V2H4_9FUNG|nr:hypothetical protein BCR36DRAFT_414499 [Piromyces finnis]|eukprot:ORX45645.1 hypothetical protein BCR36DRAFT_414499 [Piromyces finnis]
MIFFRDHLKILIFIVVVQVLTATIKARAIDSKTNSVSFNNILHQKRANIKRDSVCTDPFGHGISKFSYILFNEFISPYSSAHSGGGAIAAKEKINGIISLTNRNDRNDLSCETPDHYSLVSKSIEGNITFMTNVAYQEIYKNGVGYQGCNITQVSDINTIFPFEEVKTEMLNLSNNLAKLDSSYTEGNTLVINYGDETIFNDITNQQFLKNIDLENYDKIIINMKSKNYNFKDGNIVNLEKYANKIIWNFPNAEEIKITSFTIHGTILAPNATIIGSNGHHNGQVIAEKYHHDNSALEVDLYEFKACLPNFDSSISTTTTSTTTTTTTTVTTTTTTTTTAATPTTCETEVEFEGRNVDINNTKVEGNELITLVTLSDENCEKEEFALNNENIEVSSESGNTIESYDIEMSDKNKCQYTISLTFEKEPVCDKITVRRVEEKCENEVEYINFGEVIPNEVTVKGNDLTSIVTLPKEEYCENGILNKDDIMVSSESGNTIESYDIEMSDKNKCQYTISLTFEKEPVCDKITVRRVEEKCENEVEYINFGEVIPNEVTVKGNDLTSIVTLPKEEYCENGILNKDDIMVSSESGNTIESYDIEMSDKNKCQYTISLTFEKEPVCDKITVRRVEEKCENEVEYINFGEVIPNEVTVKGNDLTSIVTLPKEEYCENGILNKDDIMVSSESGNTIESYDIEMSDKNKCQYTISLTFEKEPVCDKITVRRVEEKCENEVEYINFGEVIPNEVTVKGNDLTSIVTLPKEEYCENGILNKDDIMVSSESGNTIESYDIEMSDKNKCQYTISLTFEKEPVCDKITVRRVEEKCENEVEYINFGEVIPNEVTVKGNDLTSIVTLPKEEYCENGILNKDDIMVSSESGNTIESYDIEMSDKNKCQYTISLTFEKEPVCDKITVRRVEEKCENEVEYINFGEVIPNEVTVKGNDLTSIVTLPKEEYCENGILNKDDIMVSSESGNTIESYDIEMSDKNKCQYTISLTFEKEPVCDKITVRRVEEKCENEVEYINFGEVIPNEVTVKGNDLTSIVTLPKEEYCENGILNKDDIMVSSESGNTIESYDIEMSDKNKCQYTISLTFEKEPVCDKITVRRVEEKCENEVEYINFGEVIPNEVTVKGNDLTSIVTLPKEEYCENGILNKDDIMVSSESGNTIESYDIEMSDKNKCQYTISLTFEKEPVCDKITIKYVENNATTTTTTTTTTVTTTTTTTTTAATPTTCETEVEFEGRNVDINNTKVEGNELITLVTLSDENCEKEEFALNKENIEVSSESGNIIESYDIKMSDKNKCQYTISLTFEKEPVCDKITIKYVENNATTTTTTTTTTVTTTTTTTTTAATPTTCETEVEFEGRNVDINNTKVEGNKLITLVTLSDENCEKEGLALNNENIEVSSESGNTIESYDIKMSDKNKCQYTISLTFEKEPVCDKITIKYVENNATTATTATTTTVTTTTTTTTTATTPTTCKTEVEFEGGNVDSNNTKVEGNKLITLVTLSDENCEKEEFALNNENIEVSSESGNTIESYDIKMSDKNKCQYTISLTFEKEPVCDKITIKYVENNATTATTTTTTTVTTTTTKPNTTVTTTTTKPNTTITTTTTKPKTTITEEATITKPTTIITSTIESTTITTSTIEPTTITTVTIKPITTVFEEKTITSTITKRVIITSTITRPVTIKTIITKPVTVTTVTTIVKPTTTVNEDVGISGVDENSDEEINEIPEGDNEDSDEEINEIPEGDNEDSDVEENSINRENPWRCGKGYGKCMEGYCCSKYGWCGKSSEYCAVEEGCQSEFGICNGRTNILNNKTESSVTVNVEKEKTEESVIITTEDKKKPSEEDKKKTSEDDSWRCGKDYGKCMEGYCCSKYGWCGKSSEYCAVEDGCQSEFGTCWK